MWLKISFIDVQQSSVSALKWSFELVSELIQNFKEQPALWHNGHPHFHNTAKRNEYLAEIAKHLRKLPGGGAADGSILLITRMIIILFRLSSATGMRFVTVRIVFRVIMIAVITNDF